MNTFIIHPTNREESSLLESLLKRMQFSFEKITDETIVVSPEEIKSINKGIDEANENKLNQSSDVNAKARALCSK